jgi:glucokinase
MQNLPVKNTRRPSKTKVKTRTQRARYTIGIDLGGTKVAAALIDRNGHLLYEVRKPTVPTHLEHLDPRRASSRPPSPAQVREHVRYVIKAMTEAALEAAQDHENEILGIGLASAGPMNIEEGTLNNPANFKGWKRVPLVALLEESLAKQGLKKPVAFQNDAIAAALGEGWVGQAKGCSTYAMITLGTGIGTGVIFNGHPAQSSGMGSEWGHIIADAVGIGKEPQRFYERSVEGLASGTGLIKRAKALGFKGESAADLALAAEKGNRIAKEGFKGASEGLAALFFNLSLGFHPEKFVVTGGMLPIRQYFLPQAIALYRDLMKRQGPDFLAPVQIAKLGNLAGVIGAARLPHLELHA